MTLPTPAALLVEGTAIEIGGKPYVMPNLNFRSLQKLEPFLKEISGVDLIIKMAYLALLRNYPDITEEYIADNAEDYEFRHIAEVVKDNQGKRKSPAAKQLLTGDTSTVA